MIATVDRKKWRNLVRSYSERTVGDWLERFRLDLEYERPHGHKNPEFTASSGGLVRAVVEVKDLCWKPDEYADFRKDMELPLAGSKGPTCPGFDNVTRPRRRFRDGAEQLQTVAGVPTLIVLHDSTYQFHLGSHVSVVEMLIGDRKLVVPIGDSRGAFEPYEVYAENGFFTDSRWRAERASISAVAILDKTNVDVHITGYKKAREALYEDGRMDDLQEGCTMSDILARVSQDSRDLERRYRRMGMDPERIEPYLVIHRNPFASVEWPREFVGCFDQLWEYDLAKGVATMAYDGLSPDSH